MRSLGGIVFIIGFVLAAILALFTATNTPMWAVFVIAVFGLIVGLLNVTDKEVTHFLVASIAFLLSFQALSSILTSFTFGWASVGTFFGLMSVFIAPAAAVVAFKALFYMAKD